MRFPCGHEEALSTKPPSYATLNWYALQNQNNKCKGKDIRYHMKHLKHILSGLTLTFFLISFSVMAVLNFRPLYYFDIGHLNISQTSGYSEEEIRENYDALIDYNNFWGPDRLEFPTLAMSENGRTHFEEVKVIFIALEYSAIVCGILSVGIILWMHKKREREYLLYTSILSIALPIILGIGIAVNWEWFFVTFHHIFFQNDYWIFYADTDPVITILPDAFFMHCAIAILAMVILGSVICAIRYFKGKAKIDSREKLTAES